jgi:predicted nucleic acid-binding protein
MIIYALDTNIITYLIKKDPQVYWHFENAISNDDSCIIPPVVYYEIKRGLLAINAVNRLKYFDKLCGNFYIGDTNIDVWEVAAKLYVIQKNKGLPIEDADLFIAAFCLVGKHPLVTNNTKHFEQIEGLTCLNWKS